MAKKATMKLTKPRMEIELRAKPDHKNFTRYLTFGNDKGKEVRIPVKFGKKKGLLYRSVKFPKGYDKMKKFVADGNRSFWDQVWLENRNGKTALDVGRVKLRITYSGAGKTAKRSFDIVDGEVNEVLGGGMTKVNLNPAAVESRYRKASLDLSSHPVARSAVRDLGKYGTDAVNGKEENVNPKYGRGVRQGSPSFAAWFYHDEKIKAGRQAFDRQKHGNDLREFFKSASRLSEWQVSKSEFIHTKTGKAVVPKPGDFLQDLSKGGMAMIVTAWDPEKCEINAVCGPKPVSLCRVRLKNIPEGKEYILGSI